MIVIYGRVRYLFIWDSNKWYSDNTRLLQTAASFFVLCQMPFAESRMPLVPRAAYSCRYSHARTERTRRNSHPRSFTEDCSNFYRPVLYSFTLVHLPAAAAAVMLLDSRKRRRLWNVGCSVLIKDIEGHQKNKKCILHLTLIQQKFWVGREWSRRTECRTAVPSGPTTLGNDVSDNKCHCYINWGALIHWYYLE